MTRTTTFAPLFEPLAVGVRTARNRIVHAPMSVCYGDEAGHVTRSQVEHYARRAQGGAGIVITENFAVNTPGRQMPKQTVVADDSHLPGLSELAGEIKRHGALAMVQLVHSGRYAGPWDVNHRERRLAPSAIHFPLTAGRVVTPQEITTEDSVRLAPMLVDAGVQFLFAIPATFETLRLPPNLGLYGRRAYSVPDTAAIKQAVGVPVIANGRLGDPLDAVQVLERAEADAIGLARPLFVDPDWPLKVARGEVTELRSCPCEPPTCLRTQLSGAVCDHWPADVIERGYLGYQA